MIRLRLTDGATALFDNVVDLFDFIVERMTIAGEL
jgi:hypothetical protein